ncbi:HAD-IA family hydrolase [Verrucomicrobiota bacterium]
MSMLLIFDLDGTLIDSRQDLCTAINLMRNHYGLPPLSLDTVSGYVGDGIRKLVVRSFQGFETDIDEAVRLDFDFYTQHLYDTTIPYPGVIEGLSALDKAGHTLALISNKPLAACTELLRHFRISDLFASVLGGDSCAHRKPSPEPIFMTLRATGVDARDAWMIGDNHTDIEAARRAGITSAFVQYGIGRAASESPAKTFDTFDELTRYFLYGH